MRKITLLLTLCFISFFVNAQRNEHSDRKLTIAFSPSSLIPRGNLQFEHALGTNWSMGENIMYYFEIPDYYEKWVGPKIELFGRYYFNNKKHDQPATKYGGNWFMQFKGGVGYLTIPEHTVYDASNTVIAGVLYNGNSVLIYDSNNWMTMGGGLAFGYKNISCRGWIWEFYLGYHYWTAPDYYTDIYKEYDALTPPLDPNYGWSDIDDDELDVWNVSLGFPLDLQFKIGRIINW